MPQRERLILSYGPAGGESMVRESHVHYLLFLFN